MSSSAEPTPLDERRQSAREAFWDECSFDGDWYELPGAIRYAIEAATRVKITPEILNSAKPTVPWRTEKQRLRAAFEAAGFEVIQ